MKVLAALGILVVTFTSCGVLIPQETQQERERLFAAYDTARQKHNPELIKRVVKDLLVGKWQYVGLEVEEGRVNVQQVISMPRQNTNAPKTAAVAPAMSSDIEGHAITANLPEQTISPNSLSPQTKEQKPTGGTTRLPRIEVTDEKSNQRILGAKAALVASTRQNLTIEFFENQGSYYYKGNNRGKYVAGQCYITAKRYGDDPFPFIRFNQQTGPEMLAFLFGYESVKQIAAKQKQKRAAMLNNSKMGSQVTHRAVAKQTAFSHGSMAGITVTEDALYLILYGDMELTPMGWMRTGGLRCTLKRIEGK